MKLKMAPNSLFAVLLRSPWWASLGLAVALSLLLRALLPADYAVAGMLGTLPFALIAAIAALVDPDLQQPNLTFLAPLDETFATLRARVRARQSRADR